MPKIFAVNWFRKGEDGKFLWPGFGDNARVLKWIFERCDGGHAGVETPIGTVPARGELDLSGLELADGAVERLLEVDNEAWRVEAASIRGHYATFGEHLPFELRGELEGLETRLS